MRLFIIFLSTFFHTFLLAQNNAELYSKVKIDLRGKEIQQLLSLGIEVDHGVIAKDRYIINDYSASELLQIAQANFTYEVIIEDVKAWYKNQNRDHLHNHAAKAAPPEDCFENASNNVPTYITPSNYTYGSMGGYVTYTEMLEVLDSMVAKFPNLITAKTPIGTPAFNTWMGNPIYWLKISDNPTINETEPEVLFTSLHHAREPNSLSQNLFYMWYLLENYGVNDEVTYLVDETEIYFIPCVNPDGYILNGQFDPTGGGMIRKNARDNNTNGTYESNADGVDLNRNYGYEWGFDNNGSSPTSNSQTYRGPSGFSEPETQAVKYFCEQHEFEITLNYHTYGNLLIHPWGYSDDITPEHATFTIFGEEMTQYNNYTFGTGTATVGYVTNGDSDDWMYGETVTKGRIFSMTPEAGDESVGFWPMASQIDEYNKANMHQNLSVSRLVLNYLEVNEINPNPIVQDLTGDFNFQAIKKGLKSGAITVSFSSLNPLLAINTAPQLVNLAHLGTQNILVNYTLNASIQNDDTFKFLVAIDNGLHIYYDTITKTFNGNVMETLFADNTGNVSLWNSNGWSVTSSTFVSAPNSITESPNGDYTSNQFKTITTINPIDLNYIINPTLSFWAKWDIENDWDYTQVLISTDNGNLFIPLCGLYTNEGSSNQDEGMPLYDNVQTNWVKESIDLSEYIGTQVLIRFLFISDGFVNEDGFYFDDFEIKGIVQAHEHNISQTAYTCNADEEGILVDTLLNQWGLDSVFTLQTIYVAPDTIYNNQLTNNENEVGVFYINFANQYGCDSTYVNSISLNQNVQILSFDNHYFQIYPNPVKNILIIKSNALSAEIILYDMMGRNTKSYHFINEWNAFQIDITDLPSGVYTLAFQIENKLKHVKLLKE